MSLEAITAATKKTPGISTTIYVALKDDVDVYPAREANSNNLSAAFTMKTGKVFVSVKVATVEGKNTINTAPIGDADGGAQEHTAVFVIPGSDPVISNKLEKMKNQECIFIVPELDGCEEDDIQNVVLGTKCAGAQMTLAQKNDGTKDYTITGVYRSAGLLNYYNGLAVPV